MSLLIFVMPSLFAGKQADLKSLFSKNPVCINCGNGNNNYKRIYILCKIKCYILETTSS